MGEEREAQPRVILRQELRELGVVHGGDRVTVLHLEQREAVDAGHCPQSGQNLLVSFVRQFRQTAGFALGTRATAGIRDVSLTSGSIRTVHRAEFIAKARIDQATLKSP